MADKESSHYNVCRATSKDRLMREGVVEAECYSPAEANEAYEQAVQEYPNSYVCIMDLSLFGGGIIRENIEAKK